MAPSHSKSSSISEPRHPPSGKECVDDSLKGPRSLITSRTSTHEFCLLACQGPNKWVCFLAFSPKCFIVSWKVSSNHSTSESWDPGPNCVIGLGYRDSDGCLEQLGGAARLVRVCQQLYLSSLDPAPRTWVSPTRNPQMASLFPRLKSFPNTYCTCSLRPSRLPSTHPSG